MLQQQPQQVDGKETAQTIDLDTILLASTSSRIVLAKLFLLH
jgi:hypothetical protein